MEKKKESSNSIINLGQNRLQFVGKPITLYLKRSFNTAHSSSTTRTNFMLKVFLKNQQLSAESQTSVLPGQKQPVGYGECGLPPKKPYCYISDINDCEKFTNLLTKSFQSFCLTVQKQTQNVNSYLAKSLSSLFNEVFQGILQLSGKKQKYFNLLRQKIYSLISQSQIDSQQEGQIWIYTQIFYLLRQAAQFSYTNPEFNAPRSALQFSLFDFIGKLQKNSVSQLICDLDSALQSRANYSFYTISHDADIQSMMKNAKQSLKFTTCIKIKFTNDIEKLIQLLVLMDQHSLGNKWIIDANACWTPADYVKFQQMFLNQAQKSQSISKKMLFVEQPFPIFKSLLKQQSLEQVQSLQSQWQQIKRKTSFIIVADESFASLKNLSEVQTLSHGINIKMEKCGGPIETVKILKQNQQSHIQNIMFGSMVSTHLGCTQTFQFHKFAQFFDIDGALLVKQPEIKGGFQWNGQLGISKVKGSGLALENFDIQKLFLTF